MNFGINHVPGAGSIAHIRSRRRKFLYLRNLLPPYGKLANMTAAVRHCEICVLLLLPSAYRFPISVFYSLLPLYKHSLGMHNCSNRTCTAFKSSTILFQSMMLKVSLFTSALSNQCFRQLCLSVHCLIYDV